MFRYVSKYFVDLIQFINIPEICERKLYFCLKSNLKKNGDDSSFKGKIVVIIFL